MKPLQQQRGLTAISIVLILGALAIFVTFALTVATKYMENLSVASHLKSLKKETDIATMKPDQIVNKLMRRFEIDNIRDLDKDDIEITPSANGITVTVDYEVRDHFLANIDVVTMFHDEVELPRAQ